MSYKSTTRVHAMLHMATAQSVAAGGSETDTMASVVCMTCWTIMALKTSAHEVRLHDVTSAEFWMRYQRSQDALERSEDVEEAGCEPVCGDWGEDGQERV
jgi:hypothetical protein